MSSKTNNNMAWISRVRSLHGSISEIFRVTGSAGGSLSVLSAGASAYKEHFGFRDYEHQIPPDDETVYYLASRTKFMVGAGIGALVEDGKMTWETRVAQVLPDFLHHDETLMSSLTISDLISQRSGLDPSVTYWQAEHGRITIEYDDFVKTISTIPVVKPLQSSFGYNNWNTALAGIILERVAGCSLGEFLQSRFFDPLNMLRTTLEAQPDWDNVAKPYIWYGNDSPPFHLAFPSPGDGRSMAGSFAAKSCIDDLARFYTAFLEALSDQQKTGKTSTPGNPFKQTARLTSPHIPISNNSVDGNYTLGWVSAKLPAPMSHTITPNSKYFKTHPLVGKGLESTPSILYAYGSTPGYLGATVLIPSTQTAILVESNTLANSDAPNWIASMVLEAFLDVPKADRNDYLAIARGVYQVVPAQFTQMFDAIEVDRRNDTQTRKATDFAGQYYNAAESFYLDVFQDRNSEKLWLCFKGLRSEKYELRPLGVDVFEWAIDYQESCRRGMWPKSAKGYFTLYFEGQEDAPADLIRWKRNPDDQGGEVLKRRTSTRPQVNEQVARSEL